MKTLLLALSLAFSLHALADQATEFRHRAYCAKSTHAYDSKISQVMKISEDEKSALFRMVFTFGRCDTLEDVQGAIKFQKRMLQLSHYGLSYPFKKIYARVTRFRPLSETELEAEISVDRPARESKNPRRFILEFWASDWVGFPFVMNVRSQDQDIELTFEGFERL